MIQPKKEERHATYSIIGYDPSNGDLGIAVESKYLAVGSIVPYARANAGVVATKFFANPTFGPKGLDLLEEGLSPEDVVMRLLAEDTNTPRRQLAVMDHNGISFSYTGEECLPWAGEKRGENYICTGNTLVSEETLSATGETFLHTHGKLWDRLVVALAAGQQAGGDSRGQQSAALLVVRKGGGYGGYTDRMIDLRVDDHPTPIDELIRILEIQKLSIP